MVQKFKMENERKLLDEYVTTNKMNLGEIQKGNVKGRVQSSRLMGQKRNVFEGAQESVKTNEDNKGKYLKILKILKKEPKSYSKSGNFESPHFKSERLLQFLAA